MRGVIYKWTHIPTGKYYIGQTTDENVRKRRFLLFNVKYAGFYVDNFRKKYNNKNEWEYTILHTCEGDYIFNNLNFWEKFYIQKYDATNPKKGLNLDPGGREVCYNHFKGKHHTEETKSILSKKSTEWVKKHYHETITSQPFRKKINVYKNSQLINTFDSLKDCDRSFGWYPGTTHKYIKKNHKNRDGLTFELWN